MKIAVLLSALLICFSYTGQSQPVSSKVYNWNAPGTKKIFTGSGAILSRHEMNAVTLAKGKSKKYPSHSLLERFFIIKKGPLKVTLNDSSAVLDRGSVVSVLPGDYVRIENTGTEAAEYYLMTYQSIAPPNSERGKKAGGSFMMHWNDMVFKPHAKGGVRQLFDRQTVMLNRFDIHITTLNEGLRSHDPHTHKNEEIILMLEGNAEMQIGTEHQKANAGDAVFLGSMVLHNLSNIGKIPCVYFAIQWN
jgi:(S)-ureidoglycine aminohydrolase